MAEKDMVGGAVVETVEVTTPETQLIDGVSMSVLTTAKGTLSALGIISAGTEVMIHPRQFSYGWMKPKAAKDAKTLGAWQESQNTDPDA